MAVEVKINSRPVRAVGVDAKRRQNWFYSAMWLAAVVVVIAGFGRSFYAIANGTSESSVIVHIHTAVFGAWLVFFIVQVWFIASRNVRLHMTLGFFGIALAALMVIVGTATAISGARRGFTLNPQLDSFAYMAFPLGNLLAFAVFVALAYRYRRLPEVHRRLMLLATVGPLMTAPLAHFFAQLPDRFNPRPPIYFLMLFIILLFSCAVYDRFTLGRFNKVSLWGAVAMFVWGNTLAALIAPSVPWHRIAEWLVDLSLITLLPDQIPRSVGPLVRIRN